MISFDPLWQTLEEKHMGKMELRERIGVSKATFAKLSKNQSITLETVDRICEGLDVPIENVVMILKRDGSDGEAIPYR